jgi:hypothetical protein
MAGRSFDFVDVVVLDQGRLVGLVGASPLLEAGEGELLRGLVGGVHEPRLGGPTF